MDVNHPPQREQQQQLSGRQLLLQGATLLEGPVSLQEEVAQQVLEDVLEEVALQEEVFLQETVTLQEEVLTCQVFYTAPPSLPC